MWLTQIDRLFLVLSAGLLCGVSAGCATGPTTPEYRIGVTTYLADDVPFPPAQANARIAVVTGSDPKEPLLEKEVKRKIEYLIAQRGFGIGSVEEADYILSAFFAIDDGTTATGTRPVYHSGGTSYTQLYTSSGQWATGTTQHPGYTTYQPYSYTYFTRYLGINLYERERWGRSKDEDLADAIAWRATTTSSGSGSDLRSIIDYLLVPTFEHFGDDTGERMRTTLREDDERVKQLRESYRQEPAR
ncbi:MAG: hypothetical protein JXB13_17835 [Phycisphaerae bacterium]|nr:hypothetical protein [Phycisphaerae bacterium]